MAEPDAAADRPLPQTAPPERKFPPLACRGVSWSMILLAAICFFLPWVNIGCGNPMTGGVVAGECLHKSTFFLVSLYPVLLLVGLIASLCYTRKRRPLVMIAACLCASGSLIYGVVLCLLPNAVQVLLTNAPNATRDLSFVQWLEWAWNVCTKLFLPAYWWALWAPLIAAWFGSIEDRLRGNDSRFPWVGVVPYFAWACTVWALVMSLRPLGIRVQGPGSNPYFSLLVYAVSLSLPLFSGLLIVHTLTRRRTARASLTPPSGRRTPPGSASHTRASRATGSG